MGKVIVPDKARSRKTVPGTWSSKTRNKIFSHRSNITNGVSYSIVLSELYPIYTKKLKWLGNVFDNNH